MSIKRSHIDFIMNLKKQGKTYSEISEAFGKKYGVRKSVNAVESTFRRYKDEYDLSTLKSVVEVKAEVIQERILADIISVIEKRKYVPTSVEFHNHTTFHADTVKKHFGSFDELVRKAREESPDTFENIIDQSLFNNDAFKDLRDYISNHTTFIITTAVTGCEPFEPGMRAIETFQKHNKAGLLILPCSDPAKQREHKNNWSLSHKLPKESVVFKDVALNDNLTLSTIKMSAKQLQPLTGLKRLGKRRGSVIVASPKQFLEFNTSSNKKEIPRALTSTGAITRADYRTDMYMSERTAFLAEEDHVLGGIIVEIQNGQIFHMRHFQFDPRNGDICDLNKKYTAKGKVEEITAELVQLPDYHVLSTDPSAKKVAKEITDLVTPDFMTLEDFFDGITINPHERNNLVALSKKSKQGLLSLEHELKACSKEIDDISKWNVKKLVFKYGNHEDFLFRYLADGDFMKQPQNKILAMKLNIAVEERNMMPFEYAMRELYPIQQPNKIQFLTVDDSFKVNGIENGAHGHLGRGGRRNPNMAELEDCYGAGNFGHNHSGSIFRSAFRAGTLTHMQLSYNHGPGAWTQSYVVQHRNGTRQLITNIHGDWRKK